MKNALLLLLLSCSMTFNAQADIPYRSMPDYPEKFTAGAVAARMVDGLGFRFYWATEGLREEDLQYKPSDAARSSKETIDHIYQMSLMLYNGIHQEHMVYEELRFAEKREKTLQTLKQVSNKLSNSNAEELQTFTIELSSGERLPFWNMINGPIADCIWHCGQIVSFRRASGNPFNPNVSLLRGKLKD